MKRNKHKPRQHSNCLLSCAVLALTFGPGVALADPLSIDRAEWRSYSNELRVDGEGREDRTVTVTNSRNASQVLGNDRVDDDDEWEVRVSSPSPVPCIVRATQSNGEVITRAVSNAPADCDVIAGSDDGNSAEGAPAPTGDFRITRARWSDYRRRVEVEGNGTGTRGRDVTVRNAFDRSQILGMDEVEDDGDWQVRRENPSPIPCRVRAEQSDGQVDEMDVANAPSTCGPKVDGETEPVNVAPTANANGPYSADVGVAVNFSSTGSSDSDGNIVSYSWNFGDGGSSSANPTHTYSAANIYTVTLTVTDNDGATDTSSTTATITEPQQDNVAPNANANGPYSGTAGNPVNFSSTGSSDPDGNIVSYSWNFGDGSSTSANPTHTYSAANTYTVTLTVTDNDGATDTSSTTATITEPQPPVASQCPDPAPTNAAEAHELCTTPYTGPEVCVACHEQEAADMHGSVHYQQNGPTDFVTNIDGLGGERGFDFAATGVNTYCGSHENSPRFTCAGCHVGNGRYPMAQADFEQLSPSSQEYHDQLANIDCLTCHQEQYRRFPDWTDANGNLDLSLFEDLTLENVTLDGNGNLLASLGDKVVRSGLEGIPVVGPNGDFEFAPAGGAGSVSFELPAESPFAPMSITTEVAVQTVHATTRQSCLSCHAGAAGANGAKRGDLTSLHANPDIGLDQHMSPAGQNMTCSECHSAVGDNGESHRVRGRGLDLRPNDVAERFTCETSGCHFGRPGDRPHADFDYNSPTEDTHAVKVACQTCHIPTYGKGVATETSRDWQDPHLSQSACNGRGGWLPREDKGANLEPSYAWFDGTSEVYFMGESLTDVPTVPLASDVAQRFGTGFAAGDRAVSLGVPAAILDASGNIDMTLGVNNPDAKLQPMKEHWGKLARNERTNTLIAHSTYDFFRTGDYDLAVQSGLAQDPTMDATDQYTVVPVHTFQTLNHGVETRGSALDCNDCHKPLSSNARIDLKSDYGYGLRTGTSAVNGSRISGTLNGDLDRICSQCHDNEAGGRGFESVHSRHVSSRNRDCAACHNFSRLDVRPGLNLNN